MQIYLMKLSMHARLRIESLAFEFQGNLTRASSSRVANCSSSSSMCTWRKRVWEERWMPRVVLSMDDDRGAGHFDFQRATFVTFRLRDNERVKLHAIDISGRGSRALRRIDLHKQLWHGSPLPIGYVEIHGAPLCEAAQSLKRGEANIVTSCRK